MQFERGDGPFTPFRDSGNRFFDDDGVIVHFDGDASRGAEIDGVNGDDRAFTIPQLSQAGGDLPRVFPTRLLLVPEVPASLEGNFGIRLSVCGVTGWEMRIALADLNTVVDRPSGFEVQINQDLDEEARDAMWGWAHPSVATRDDSVRRTSPSPYGTVTLLSEGF